MSIMKIENRTNEFMKWSGLVSIAGGLICLLSDNKQIKNVGTVATVLGATSFLASCTHQKRGVKIESKNLQILLSALNPNERKYIKLDNDNYIVDTLVNRAKKEIKIGLNFNSLIELINSSYVIEIYIATKIIFLNKNGTIDYEAFPTNTQRERPLDPIWIQEGGSPDFKGKSKKKRTYQEMEQFFLINFKENNEPTYQGKVGVTLYPITYKPNNYNQYSTNDNIQIFVNSNAPIIDQVTTLTHEAFGHALFHTKGIAHSHGTTREVGKPGCNDLLENQIINCRKEAEYNYDL